MTRAWLVKDENGVYRLRLEKEIEERLNPIPQKQDFKFWLKASGYVVATLLAGFGALIGFLVMCSFALVFWGIGKVRRTWR